MPQANIRFGDGFDRGRRLLREQPPAGGTMKRRIAAVAVLAAGLTWAAAARDNTKSYSDLLRAFQAQGWKGSGPAELHNMALYNWEPTGNGDVVHCSICDKSEGGWST